MRSSNISSGASIRSGLAQARWVIVRCDSEVAIGGVVSLHAQLYPATIIHAASDFIYPPSAEFTDADGMVGAPVLMTLLGKSAAPAFSPVSVAPKAGCTYSGILTGDVATDATGSGSSRVEGRPRVVCPNVGFDPGAVSWKSPVRTATTANVNLASGLAAGQSVGGVVLGLGDRVLVKDQSNQAENGIYVAPASGAASRSEDADTALELWAAVTLVREGTNAGRIYKQLTNATLILGSTAVVWGLVGDIIGPAFSKAGSVPTYTDTTGKVVGDLQMIRLLSEEIFYPGGNVFASRFDLFTGNWATTDPVIGGRVDPKGAALFWMYSDGWAGNTGISFSVATQSEVIKTAKSAGIAVRLAEGATPIGMTLTFTPVAADTDIQMKWPGLFWSGTYAVGPGLAGAGNVLVGTELGPGAKAASGIIIDTGSGTFLSPSVPNNFTAPQTFTASAATDTPVTVVGTNDSSAPLLRLRRADGTVILDVSRGSAVFSNADGNFTFNNNVTASGQFNGSGAGLTNLPAASLTGTVADARLSANVPILVGGVLPTSTLPALAISEFKGTVASQAAMLALVGEKGDWAIRSDLATTWIIVGDDPTQLASWQEIEYPAGAVTSVNGQTGAVVLGAADVGAQPSDTELTALAGLASAADRLPYFTGAGAAALATFTAFGRSLVDDADAAAGRATLGLVAVASSGSAADLTAGLLPAARIAGVVVPASLAAAGWSDVGVSLFTMQSLTSSVWNTIQLDLESTDPEGRFNIITHTFTPPLTGLYAVTFVATIGGAPGRVIAAIWNGTTAEVARFADGTLVAPGGTLLLDLSSAVGYTFRVFPTTAGTQAQAGVAVTFVRIRRLA